MLSKEFNGNILPVCLYIRIRAVVAIRKSDRRGYLEFFFFLRITFNLTRKRLASQCKRFALVSLHKILSIRENVKCLTEKQNAELSSI